MPEMGSQTSARTSRPARRKAAAEADHPTSLADALFTTTQQRVLSLLFGSLRAVSLRRVDRADRLRSGAVQRELKRLVSCGLVNVTRIGKQKHHRANPDSPVFEELCGLVLKTVAVVEPIRQVLEPLADRIALDSLSTPYVDT